MGSCQVYSPKRSPGIDTAIRGRLLDVIFLGVGSKMTNPSICRRIIAMDRVGFQCSILERDLIVRTLVANTLLSQDGSRPTVGPTPHFLRPDGEVVLLFEEAQSRHVDVI